MNYEDIYAQISERYGSAAKGSDARYSNTIAKAFGYSEEDLGSVPKDANLGLSCGTPLAIATIREVSCLSSRAATSKAEDNHNRERQSLTWDVAPGSMYSSRLTRSAQLAKLSG
jgi:hypothetical protein